MSKVFYGEAYIGADVYIKIYTYIDIYYSFDNNSTLMILTIFYCYILLYTLMSLK